MEDTLGSYCVCFDVEAIDANPFKWFSIGIVAAYYPSGKIVAIKEFFVDRTEVSISDPKIATFWKNHPEAWKYNLENGRGIHEEDAELAFCRYIEDIKKKYPHFNAISDNPAFDFLIVDDILQRNQFERLSIRTVDVYHKPHCAWSYQMNLAKIFKCQRSQLFSNPFVCRLMKVDNRTYGNHHQKRQKLEYITKRPIEIASSKNEDGKHTALHDCFFILTNYFKCLDISEAFHQLVVKELSTITTSSALMYPGEHKNTDEHTDHILLNEFEDKAVRINFINHQLQAEKKRLALPWSQLHNPNMCYSYYYHHCC